MKKVIQLRKKERKNLLKKAEKYLEELRKRLGPLSGVVFGSVSRGDFNDASDIDIVVIAEELPTHPLRRLDVLLSPWVPGIDPKGYTRSEFEQLKQKGNPFIQLILEEGIVLLDEIGVFKKSSQYVV
ncbi:MAG: nucleotidyltransferase domain-containing protein [Theionarchaea archaeon]|nr:nucleotidyltransferase domain-containing protein [Theionarchaea archaeon]